MERIQASLNALMPLQNDSETLGMLSLRPVDADMGQELLLLMSQAQAAKPNQEVLPGTADMFLQAWEELVAEVGMERFQAGLWKALRKTAFFPQPFEIEAACNELKAEEQECKRRAREAAEAAQRRADSEAWQTQHRKDFPEQYDAAGKRIPPVAVISEPVQKRLAAIAADPVRIHTIESNPMGSQGWYSHKCCCGRQWDTAAQILTCPAENWKKFVQLTEASLANLHAHPVNNSCTPAETR